MSTPEEETTDELATQSTKDAAREYLKKHKWSVFRLMPRDKKPAGEWAKYYRERMDVRELADWGPSANVAIVTGAISGMAVVDFDIKNGATREQFDAFIKDYPTDRVVQTPGGGWHAYYKIPEGKEVRCRTGVMQGVDIRGEGGYVVGPPSIHPNGGQYKWLSQGMMGQMPEKFIALHTERTVNYPGWVEKAFAGVGEGGRDNTCAQLAGYLYYRGVSRSVAVSILQGWNAQNDPPLPREDIEKTVLSVYKRAEAAPVTESVFGTDPAAKSAFEFTKFSDYMAKFSESENRWLVKDWLPANTIAFVISPPGTYKTWVMLDLCVSIAGGKPFLDAYETLEKGPVMILQQEDHNGSLVERLSVIMHQRYLLRPTWEDDGDLVEFDSPPDLPIYHHTERKLRFDDKQIMRAFVQQVEKIRPKLVVLDPLYSATSTEDFMAKAAQDMFVFKDLRDRFGTSFLICHHTNKSGDDRGRTRAWGSQFLNAFLETGWQFSQRAGGKSIGVRRHFKSAAEPKDVVLKFDISTDPDEYRYIPMVVEKGLDEDEDEEFDVSAPKQGKAPKPPKPKPGPANKKAHRLDEKEKPVLDFLLQQLPRGANVDSIVEKTGFSRAHVYRVIKTLMEEELIDKTNIGTEVRYVAK